MKPRGLIGMVGIGMESLIMFAALLFTCSLAFNLGGYAATWLWSLL